jgi:hypothetical protein
MRYFKTGLTLRDGFEIPHILSLSLIAKNEKKACLLYDVLQDQEVVEDTSDNRHKKKWCIGSRDQKIDHTVVEDMKHVSCSGSGKRMIER